MPVITDVLAVVDAGDSQVELRDRTTLAVITAVGSVGSGNAQLDTPTHIAFGANYVHIQDTGNSRVMRWNWEDLSYYGKVLWSTLGLAWNVDCLTIDKVRMLLGRDGGPLSTNAFRFMSPYTALTDYALADGGVIVGMAKDNDYLYLADSSGNQVLQYALSGGAPVAYTTIPAGYTVAGLAVDDTKLYVPCNHAANDTKVLILNKTAMTLVTSGDLLAKTACYAMTVDATKLYWTDTDDHSINWILKSLAGAITSAVDLTAPAGVAVQSPMFADLHDTAFVLSGGVAAGGVSAAIDPPANYPVLPAGGAAGGGLAAGSWDPVLPYGAAAGAGAVAGSAVLVPTLPSGAAGGAGAVMASIAVAAAADYMSASSDSGDRVATLTGVTRE